MGNSPRGGYRILRQGLLLRVRGVHSGGLANDRKPLGGRVRGNSAEHNRRTRG